jgi:hypothetical protein
VLHLDLPDALRTLRPTVQQVEQLRIDGVDLGAHHRQFVLQIIIHIRTRKNVSIRC